MGRKIYKVPLDFAFPVGSRERVTSWSDAAYKAHADTCAETAVHETECDLEDHSECDVHLDCAYEWEPPKGDGWQLWQLISRGPISPVFTTADELIEWMCLPDPQEWYEDGYPDLPWAQGWRREVADPFVRGECEAGSFVVQNRRLTNGPEVVIHNEQLRSTFSRRRT